MHDALVERKCLAPNLHYTERIVDVAVTSLSKAFPVSVQRHQDFTIHRGSLKVSTALKVTVKALVTTGDDTLPAL